MFYLIMSNGHFEQVFSTLKMREEQASMKASFTTFYELLLIVHLCQIGILKLWWETKQHRTVQDTREERGTVVKPQGTRSYMTQLLSKYKPLPCASQGTH